MASPCCRAAAIARTVLAIVIALAVAGTLLHAWPALGQPRLGGIGVASGSFVLIALLSGGLRSAPGILMVIGLVGCFLGDMLGARSFVASAGAFLVSHLFFIAAYALRRGDARRGAAVLVLFIACSALILSGLYGRAEGAERVLAVAYALVISAMVGGAASAAHLPGGKHIFVAAVLFYVSDIAVAYWKFVGGDAPYDWYCYPLYYTACTMLAFGAGAVAGPRSPLAPPGTGQTTQPVTG